MALARQPPQPAALALAVLAPGNAEQPGAKTAGGIETVDMLPGEDETFLRQVVRIGRAQPAQESAQALLVHMDQTPESVGRTGLGARHQGRFGISIRHKSL